MKLSLKEVNNGIRIVDTKDFSGFVVGDIIEYSVFGRKCKFSSVIKDFVTKINPKGETKTYAVVSYKYNETAKESTGHTLLSKTKKLSSMVNGCLVCKK